ncbi:MAG: ComEA family DNA-binding protein [Nitrospira sp.]
MKSFFFKLGLLVVAMGISLWAIAGARPKDPLAAVAEPPRLDALPLELDSSAQAPKMQAVGGETKEVRQSPSLLDLNRATVGELEALPGIGAVLAQRVIEFRTSAGGFRRVDDLREVKGIGSKKFDRIKALVTVSTSGSQGAKQREL